jgi:hypothetical protein
MILRIAVFILVGALLAGRAEAQSGGAYSLGWSTVDGGGQTFATGGVYRMGGTAGQPDAARVTGGSYALQGGFWAAASQASVDVPVHDPVPLEFVARMAQPNPFRSSTTLAFDLPVPRAVRFVVYGIDGRAVRKLAEGSYDAGRHRAIWDGRDDRGRLVSPGIYFARLVAGEFTSTLRIVRLD